MKSAVTCCHCGVVTLKENGAIGRAGRAGLRLFCDRACAGLARRIEKSKEAKLAEKAAYDRQRRTDLADRIKAEKRAYHKRTYDPAKAREERRLKMPKHVEYCRRPEYKKWKAQYDQKHRARTLFGDFGEAAILLNILESEVASRATRTEISATNGTLNKWIQRRRDYDRQTDRS